MTIDRIKKLNEIKVPGKPEGWMVKAEYENGHVKRCEYGVWVDENTFIGIPLHFSVLSKLRPLIDSTEDIKYYNLPNDFPVKVIAVKAKSGKMIPLIVEAREDQTPDFLVSINCKPEDINGTESVIAGAICDSKVVKYFIPKNKKYIVIVAVRKYDGAINPSVQINITTGVTGDTKATRISIDANIEGISRIHDTIDLTTPLKTEFIDFDSFIRKPAETESNIKTKKAMTFQEIKDNRKAVNRGDRRTFKK